MERRKLVTENTVINIDKEAIKDIAQEWFWESLVEYANFKHNTTVLELEL